MTAATATAAALTVGMAPPSPDKALTWRDVLLTAGPDYIQLIEDMSKSLDNMIIAQGNVNEAFESFWDPFSSASGGLLPSFDSDYDYNDLTTLEGILGALADALENGTDIEAVPGIPAGTAATVLAGILGGLGVETGPLGSVLDSLGAVDGVLGSVSDVLSLVRGLQLIELIDDNVDLSELLGLTANQSSLTTTWSWFGLDETTSVGNTYVNLDQLSLSELAGNLDDALLGSLLGNLGLGGVLSDLGIGSGLTDLSDILAALDIVATPDITAWIPAASGSYDLPFDGSAGFLAAMPTIAIGPLDSLVPDGVNIDELLEALGADGLADTHSATVIAVPIFAAGGELPFRIASFGGVSTSVLFPTATGVTSLAGTSLQTLNIPFLSTTITNTNVLQAWYVGTNGVNYNSGQSVLLANVAGVPIPIEYSMGAFNVGTTGIGVTLPSLFGVGLVPPIQIGEPVGQESSDGLIGKDVLNLGLSTPTQVTDVATLIGLGAVFDPVESVGTTVWNATVKPVGEQIKGVLNENVGSFTNGAASQFKQVTGSIADATGGDQSASTTSLAAAPSSANGADTGGSTDTPITTNAKDLTNVSANLNDRLNKASASITNAANNIRTQSDAAVKRAQTQLNKIAADGQKAINNTVNGVTKAVNDTVSGVQKAAAEATNKTAANDSE
ncbi:hypothetical protein A5662_06670 [Mycobacteriaceae bacterium 1482268.1]|nr:hypothetical protein A5662_06670 [Mycobacteriaceae bacterium 1482268.1]